MNGGITRKNLKQKIFLVILILTLIQIVQRGGGVNF